MKYAGNVTILDDEGNSVFERELTADEIIDELVKDRQTVSRPIDPPRPAEEEDMRPGKKKKRKKTTCSKCEETGHTAKTCGREEKAPKQKKEKKSRKGLTFEHKPCCGSNGPRHKKDCPELKRTHPLRQWQDPKPRTTEDTSADSNQEERELVKTEKMEHFKYREVKKDQQSGISALDSSTSQNVPHEEVKFAYASDNYGQYLINRSKA